MNAPVKKKPARLHRCTRCRRTISWQLCLCSVCAKPGVPNPSWPQEDVKPGHRKKVIERVK